MVCGVLAFTVMVIVLVLVRVRTKRSAATAAANTYNADNCDSYRAYEPSPPQSGITGGTLKKKANNNNNSGPPTAANKTWHSETLPRSRSQSSSSFINNNLGVTEGVHNSSEFLETGTMRRGHGYSSHTLTKTNPYRHKVLTNGSFLNLKESQVRDA